MPRFTTRSRRGGEFRRSPGWLKLFYDLLFVVLVAQLAHSVVADPGWVAGLRLLVPFLPAGPASAGQ